MEYGGEQSLNDLIEKRREDGLQAFPVATIEKVALHVARGLQVYMLNICFNIAIWLFHMFLFLSLCSFTLLLMCYCV